MGRKRPETSRTSINMGMGMASTTKTNRMEGMERSTGIYSSIR
jgi:hypothetical protein